MPRRETKRGAERTPLAADWDVVICGASFAGLATARQLAGTQARVLIMDRYAIGERQTSACAAPTEWLRALDLDGSIQQTFSELVVHTPHLTRRMRLPFTFSTFDYSTLCGLLWEQCDARFETAKVDGRDPGPPAPGEPITVHTDRGRVRAPLVVDALGWKRVLDTHYQPPDAPLSRGLEVHPDGAGSDLAIWIDRSYVPAGYAWSFPADAEQRVGVGSFDPRFGVKEPTVRLAGDLDVDATRFQGNWIPHRLRGGVRDGVFFVGDSAGHCLPLTAEGIRTALYFGLFLGDELRRVLAGETSRETALRRYRELGERHEWQFRWMLRTQRLVPRIPPLLLSAAIAAISGERFTRWSFGHYLRIAHPALALARAKRPTARRELAEAA